MNVKIKTALISCYDKTGLKEFVGELIRLNPGLKIYCSSGTFKELQVVARINLIEVSEYVGFKEMPDGLVKTLHPKIHSGILADLGNEDQKKYLDDNEIDVFDLVVVNLYPFKKGNFGEARKNMDIGGVSLLEAGCKNFIRVVVISSRSDYGKLLEHQHLISCFFLYVCRLQQVHLLIPHLLNYHHFQHIDTLLASSSHL